MTEYGGLIDQLEISFTHVSADGAEATMPITDRILQPFGFVHGGATLSLLETVASYAAIERSDQETERTFGVGINVRHRKPGRAGAVRGVAEFDCEENGCQIWRVTAYDDAGDAMSDGTFTTKTVSLERLKQKGLA